MSSNETDLDGCELIIDLIEQIERRLSATTEAEFLSDRDEIDLTAYRLSIIGETAHKFTPDLKLRHPEIPWSSIYGMRNVIAHNYARLDPGAVWRVSHRYLTPLQAVCQEEIERLSQ